MNAKKLREISSDFSIGRPMPRWWEHRRWVPEPVES